MSFVSDSIINLMAVKYGEPRQASFYFPVTPAEHERIRASQVQERNHDVTLYIRKGEQFVVIAKHMYPEGLFRAPSGGLKPGEEFETGARREAYEETGCRIAIQRFLLKTEVTFETITPIRSRAGENSPIDVGGRRPRLPQSGFVSDIGPAGSLAAHNRPDSLFWRSFVFLADWVSGDFHFTDTDEIRAVRLASLDEFDTFSQIMRSTTIGGLHYRAALHDEVKGLL